MSERAGRKLSGIIFVGKTAERSVTNAANTSSGTVASDQLMSTGFSREMPKTRRSENLGPENHQNVGARLSLAFTLSVEQIYLCRIYVDERRGILDGPPIKKGFDCARCLCICQAFFSTVYFRIVQ